MTTILEHPGSYEFQIKIADMQQPMVQEAIQITKNALQRHQIESQIAKHIKQHFDIKYYPNWHCLVGKSFSTVVTYESRHYIHFKIAQLSVILFKFG